MRREPNQSGMAPRQSAWWRHVVDALARLTNSDRKWLLIHAARTSVAVFVCWWLATRFGLNDGYWGAISAIIVLQSEVGATIRASRDRILGTLIGAVLGFSCTLFGTIPWNYILAVFLAVAVCGLLNFRNSSRLAGVTVTIVMLVQSNSPKRVAFDRVVQVVLGIMVAVVVTLVILPRHARSASLEADEQEFGGCGRALARAIRIAVLPREHG